MNKLTAKKVQGKLKPGMHNDGGGLYLRVSKSGAKSWILRCRVQSPALLEAFNRYNTYYQQGRWADALPYATEALRLGEEELWPFGV